MNKLLSGIVNWLLPLVAIIVGTLFVVVVAGIIVYAVKKETISTIDSLPYSRPHLDFVREDNVRCVAWIVVEAGHYFVLCQDEPPMIASIADVHRLGRPRI